MTLVKYFSFCIVVIFTTFAHAYEKEENHLCEEAIRRLTDDGHVFYDKVLVCCPGYIIDTSGKCMPFCERHCIYGFCKAPNECECMEGYKMIEDECVPTCKNKCINGYCRKPNVCGCKPGHELDTKNLTTCIPVCEPKCGKHSKCTHPNPPDKNRCQCISGYTENWKTKGCDPICTNKCTNGYCSAPEKCECFNGYELDITNKTNCIPKCEPRCQMHSSCIEPNKCVCNDGYKLNEISKECKPICEDKIENSRCIEPPNTWICIENYQHDRRIDKCILETCLCNSNGYCLDNKFKCECYDGFTKNVTTGQCEPMCQPTCENSICIANDLCQCLDGYHKTSVDHICEHNDLCNGRMCENGECLITGECKCKAGYVKSLSYSGQIQCDKEQIFIRKAMATILGVPMLLATCTLVVIYVIAKKKSYNVEEQEMMLIERN